MNLRRPPPRQWLAVHNEANDQFTPVLLTIMSSNILSQRNTTGRPKTGYDGMEINDRATYNYCPDIYLDWEYRKKLIVREIEAINPDVACLQEVEAGEFQNYFTKELAKIGYKGIFCARSAGTRKRSKEESDKVDGCATFYKSDKLILTDTQHIDFNGSMHDTSKWVDKNARPLCGGLDPCHKGETSEFAFEMFRLMTNQGCVALCSMFKTTDKLWLQGNRPKNIEMKNKYILICNAHLESKFAMTDVRIVQSMILVKRAQQIMKDYKDSELIICGDLNALRESGCLRYLTKGKISLGDPDFCNMPYNRLLNKMFGNHDADGCYSHKLELKPAIKQDVMPYSCLLPHFKGMLDHILFHGKSLQLHEVLKGPVDEKWLKDNKIKGTPCQHLPSDHFPLSAKFLIKPKEENKVQFVEDPTHDGLKIEVDLEKPGDCTFQ